MFSNWICARRTLSLALIALIGLTSAGCGTDLKAQNEALFKENQELHGKLQTHLEAQDALEADRAKDQERIAALEKKLRDGNATAKKTATGNTPSWRTPGNLGNGIEIEQGAGKVTVRIPGDVLFSSGRVSIRSTAQSALNRIATSLNTQYAGKQIRVEGHTDSDPIRKSKWRDNMELSVQRALAVQRYLTGRGVSATRLTPVGYAATRPRATNRTSSGKAKNRRVEIVVVTSS